MLKRHMIKIISILYVVIPYCIATTCLICSSSISNEDCNAKGVVRRCRPYEVCGNKVTRTSTRMLITKRCTVRRSCSDSCRERGRAAVCSKCCKSDSCNQGILAPESKVFSSTPGTSRSSSIRRASATTGCSSLNVRSVAMRCVRLKSGNAAGTTCLFWCSRHDYVLRGPSRISCVPSNDGYTWSRRPPICISRDQAQHHATPGNCRPLEYEKSNTIMRCSDEFNFRSRCTFTCKGGYFMVEADVNKPILSGVRNSVCWRGTQTPVVWTKQVPRCIMKRCPILLKEKFSTAVCTDWIWVDSVCDFSCLPGYEQVGPRFISCINYDEESPDGPQWNDTVPICKPRKCPPLELPLEKISVNCSEANFYSSKCRFQCAKGHYMTSNSGFEPLPENGNVSRCLVSRKDEMYWKPPNPKCWIKTCSEITHIDDGVVSCTNGNNHNSKCTFTCSDAFLLNGNKDLTCIEGDLGNSEFGVWDADVPWCRPKVCDPLVYNTSNTEVSCTDAFKYGTTCTFSCFAGHFMTTPDGLKLIDTGKLDTECIISPQRTVVWTEVAPMCHLKSCEELREPKNGMFTCTDGSNHGSACTLSCLAGYGVQGRKRINCVDVGAYIPKSKWNHDIPRCRPKPCPTLEYDQPTTNLDCTQGDSFKSICTFTCKEGYYMPSPERRGVVIGNSHTVCILNNLKELQWSDNAPQCLLKTCSKLNDPENGKVRCSDETQWNSVCKFSCDPGYETDAEPTLRCIDDGFNKKEGVWNNDPPSCIRRKCPDFVLNLEAIGVLCTNDYKFESKCEFQCMVGHYMTRDSAIVSSAKSTCGIERNTMIWSEAPPLCKLKSCPAAREPDRGLLRCNNRNEFKSACMFMCSPGFYLLGERIVTCEDNGINDPFGVWDFDMPTCERKSCEIQERTSTDRLTESCTDGYLFETICTYNCDQGYYMSNKDGVTESNRDQVECVVSGRDMTWSSNLPLCTLKTCPDLRNPENGGSTCTGGNNFTSICTFFCEQGYNLRGSKSTTCQESKGNQPVGPWNNPTPRCEPRSCGRISYDLDILTMACTQGQKFKSICEFSCNVGYYTIGEDSDDFLARANATCTVLENDDMVWSRKPPKCQVKSCETHSDFADGRIRCTNGDIYKSVCTFECLPGFELIGQRKTTCLDPNRYDQYGDWSSEQPICQPRPCPALQYEESNTKVNCTADNMYRSVCSFSCFHGHYMTTPNGKQVVDETSTQCDVRSDRMYWTKKAPKCVLKQCVKARKPIDGNVDCTNKNIFGSDCMFSCSIVRELKGSEILTCDADDRNVPQGIWSADFPQCELRSCPDWEIERRAIVETCSNFYKYGSMCTFTCNEGFYVPAAPGTLVRETTTAQCDLEGTAITWVGTPPPCKIKTCLPLKFPGNGTYDCSDELDYDTKCIFSCTRGYLLIGIQTFTCEDDGTSGPMGIWDATEEPVCEPRSCKKLPYDVKTQDVECNFGIKYGSVCKITCVEGYYMTAKNGIDLIDNASAICDVDPSNKRDVTWDHDEPKCIKKKCLPLTPPLDGKVICKDGLTFGSKCIFECQPGFKLIGLSTTSCKDDGQNIPTGVWGKEPPSCEPKSCARLISNSNTTNYQCTEGWKYRSICTFSCNKGYFITKGDGRTIVETAKTQTRCGRGIGDGMAWSANLPICNSKFCLAIRPKRNMTVSCTDKFKYSSVCDVSCDPPFKLSGPPRLTCIDDENSPFSGKWDERHWGLRCRR
uniref:complement receptor type 1-like n=1 Tax=Styela clava TaxID=7725 RepID=UPI00193A1558|nr:complement receptor type 1-like [Styela clava]